MEEGGERALAQLSRPIHPRPACLCAAPLSTHPAHGAQRVEHAEVILAGLCAFPVAPHPLDAGTVVCRVGRGGKERAGGRGRKHAPPPPRQGRALQKGPAADPPPPRQASPILSPHPSVTLSHASRIGPDLPLIGTALSYKAPPLPGRPRPFRPWSAPPPTPTVSAPAASPGPSPRPQVGRAPSCLPPSLTLSP